MMENLSHAAGAQQAVEILLPAPQREEQRRRMARIKRAIRRKTSGAVHELAVEMQGEALRLRGRCASFYCKQIAQHAAMHYLVGETLINDITVEALPR